MADSLPEQPENISENKSYWSFSECVNAHLKSKRKSRADLERLTGLSKARISRIVRNSNDRGSTYAPDIYDVMAISIGLKMNREEKEELFLAAFPEMKYWDEILDNGMDIDEADEVLYRQGLHQFRNDRDE